MVTIPGPIKTRPTLSPAFAGRLRTPGAMIAVFTIIMSACLLGLLAWKANQSRESTLARAETEIHNLAHSFAEHATNTFKAVDVATAGMVDLLKYQTPLPERFNPFLRASVRSLPQLREIAVLGANGEFLYASADELPRYNNSDRDYFIYHRDNSSADMRITGPVLSRMLKTQVIILSKRITKPDGSFGGILFAMIDCEYFSRFYQTFRFGTHGGVTLLTRNGLVLSHTASKEIGRDLSSHELFKSWLPNNNTGFYKIVSPLDGVTKYFGYERSPDYGTISTVALPEGELLSNWRQSLLGDVIAAAALLCVVGFLGTVLSAQFRYRVRAEQNLRNREHMYRLLTDNIADIVILLDGRGAFRFVSQSVKTVLGWEAENLVGTSCFDMVHPDDTRSVREATARLVATNQTQTVRFRTYRSDGSILWVEIAFRLASESHEGDALEMVGVLRDITHNKAMEDELTALNARLSELARTDGLTGLANRRSLDGFLHRSFETPDDISVLMIDIDHFKKFNDHFGHQAGDQCLKRVAQVIAKATEGDRHFAARYGGEEFSVVLTQTNEQRAYLIAETIRLQIKQLAIAHPGSPQGTVSVSIGVASRTEAMLSETALIAEADMALYEAKRGGRDKVMLASKQTRLFVDATLAPALPTDSKEPASR